MSSGHGPPERGCTKIVLKRSVSVASYASGWRTTPPEAFAAPNTAFSGKVAS